MHHIYDLLIKNLIFDHKAASTAANKKCHQWDVRQVLPIGGIFAERCICSLLLKNWVGVGSGRIGNLVSLGTMGIMGIMGTMGTMGITIPNLLKFPSFPSFPSLGPLGPLRPLRPLRGRVSGVVRNHLNYPNVLIVLSQQNPNFL